MNFTGKKQTFLSTPELLSPVGSWDCLLAAIANGADAVYLGTKEFNARVNARNFSLEDLSKVVTHSHNHGVRVYLTMNTLVKNHEIQRFLSTISRAYTIGVDGVIIQHLSFLKIIKDNFPGLKVFMSTQAAVGNTSGASLLKSADRIILPRELPLNEVKEIISSGISVEVFVHGALCFGYSGLCLFSSFVGNRSGNRGSCAQLCRQKYNHYYPLSTRELCVVGRIPELIQAGITGFKIEGRMRSPLYVAVATRLYRKAIDSYLGGKFVLPRSDMAEMEVVFNREFTEGFIFNNTSLVSTEKPMNRGAFLGVVSNGEIILQRPVFAGDGVGIWDRDAVAGSIIKEIVSSGKRVNNASVGDKVSLGIQVKDGSRIYLTSCAQIIVKPDFSVTKSPIVLPDRKMVKALLPEIKPSEALKLKLLAKVYSIEEAKEASQAGADIVFYDIFSADFPNSENWSEEARLGAYLPRIMNESGLSLASDLLKGKNPGAIMTGNTGFLARREEYNVPVYLDYALNCFNEFDLMFFQGFKVLPMLSPELSLKEMMEFQNKEAVVFCHGDIVLVNTLIPIEDKELINDKGLTFPVRKEYGYWQILNSHPFGIFNDIRKLHEAGFRHFFVDKLGESARFVALYRNILQHNVANRRARKGYTAGHLYRPVS
jgi:collagenase-like PrtC family protease